MYVLGLFVAMDSDASIGPTGMESEIVDENYTCTPGVKASLKPTLVLH